MRRRKIERSKEERELFTDLYYTIFPICTDVYKRANANNNVLALGKLSKSGGLPPTSAAEALVELCGNEERCLSDLNKVKSIADELTRLRDSGLSGKNLTTAVQECDSVFDNYKTTAELVPHLAKLLLDLSNDTFEEVYKAYMDNLNYLANNIAKNPSIVDEPNFALDTLVLLVTLGLIPSARLTPNVVNTTQEIFTQYILDTIYAQAFYLDDTNVTSNLVLLSSETPSSPPPQTTPPPPPSTSPSTPPIAKDIIVNLVSHCDDTWDRDGIDVTYLYKLSGDPEFYRPIDKYIEEVAPKDIDFKSTMASLIDNIDCKQLEPYLRSSSGVELRGAALRSVFSDLVKRVIECGAKYSGDPNKFKECVEGSKVPRPLEQEEIEEMKRAEEEAQKNVVEQIFTNTFDDLLVNTGLQPTGSYKKSVEMINYFLSLLKQYGLNTDDYTKLSSMFISNPDLAYAITNLLENTPVGDRKPLVMKISMLLDRLASYPSNVKYKAFDLFNDIVTSVSGTSKPIEYLDSLSNLLTDIDIIIPNRDDRIYMFNTLDALVKLLKQYPEDQREDILYSINFTLEKIEEYKKKYPQLITSYLKSFLSITLERLREGLGRIQPPEEQKPAEEVPQQAVQLEAEGKVEDIVNKNQLANIIINANKECKVYPGMEAYERHETVSGLCLTVLYFRLEGKPILFNPNDKKVYVFGNSEFGNREVSILDRFVKYVAEARDQHGIVGTKVTYIYVTQGTKNVKSNEIYVFVPFLPPYRNISPFPVYVYDLKTLPRSYYYSLFVDFVDTDVFHLLYMKDDNEILLALPASYNFKKDDIILVKEGVSGPQTEKWGELKK